MNSKKKLFSFNSDESQFYRELKIYRLYIILGVGLIPAFSVLTWSQYSRSQHILFFIFSLLFLTTYATSFYVDYIKRILSSILLVLYILLSLFAIYVVHEKQYDMNYSFGLVILFFSLSMVLYRPLHILIYYGFLALFGTISIATVDNPVIEIQFLIEFLVVFLVLGFFSVHYRSTIQERIKEDEHFLLSLFNKTFDAIFLVNAKTKEIYECNNIALILLEAESKREIIGFTNEKFQKHQLLNETVVEIDKYIREKGIWNSEQKFISLKGNIKWCRVIITLIKVKEQESFVIRLEDITENVLRRQELKKTQEDYKLLVDNINKGLLKVNKEGSIDFVNNQLCKILTLTKDQVLAKKIDKIFSETIFSVETINDVINENINGISLTAELNGYTQEGEERWLKCSGTPVYDSKQEIDGCLLIITDITQEKAIFRSLHQSEERYRTLVETLSSGIEKGDTSGKILYASPALHKIYECEEGKIVGRSVYDFMLTEEVDKFRNQFDNVFSKQQKPFPYKGKNVTKSGKIIDIQVNWSFSYDQFGKVDGFTAVITDITQLKIAEEDHMRLKMTEKANEQLKKEIASRKKVESQLILSQKYTRNIIDSSLDMIWAADIEGKITEFNTASEQLFGYTREEVIGKNISMLYSDFHIAELLKNSLMNERGYFSGEVDNRKKSGEDFISFLSASVLKDEQGLASGIMGVARDITELKQAEERLKKSEERYRDIFENATDMIQSVDENGQIMYVNNAWKENLGYCDDDVIGKNIFNIIHPDCAEKCKITFQKLSDGENVKETEIEYLTKENYKIISRGNISAKYENGKLVSTRGIFRNITDQKAIEEAIKESETKYQALFNQAYIGIARVSLDGKFLQANDRLCDMLGYKKDEIITKDFKDITYIEDIDKSVLFLNEIKKSLDEKRTFEKRYIHRSGRIILANITVSIVRDHENNPDYFVTVFDDITEKNLAETHIKESLKEKEVLLKEIHHRVKNNLQVVSSILNLQSSYIKDKNVLKIFKEGQNRIKSMSFIHESLYQTSTFSNINFSEYIVNLSNNLLHSYQVFDNLVDLKIISDKVFLNLDQAIPCGLILNELISNALKYAFPINTKGVVTIVVKEHDREILLEVSDNGIGLPEKFDILTTETLGLQLVNSLIEQIDGQLSLDRSKGTKFSIKFNKE